MRIPKLHYMTGSNDDDDDDIHIQCSSHLRSYRAQPAIIKGSVLLEDSPLNLEYISRI